MFDSLFDSRLEKYIFRVKYVTFYIDSIQLFHYLHQVFRILMKSWTTGAKLRLDYILPLSRESEVLVLSDIKSLTMIIMRLLLHDNKGIKDKFTPHTPYPGYCLSVGRAAGHENLLTSRGDKGIQFESQCKLMKLRRVHELNILACYHLQTRSFLRRHVSTSALYPCSLIPSSSRVKDLILSLSGLNS